MPLVRKYNSDANYGFQYFPDRRLSRDINLIFRWISILSNISKSNSSRRIIVYNPDPRCMEFYIKMVRGQFHVNDRHVSYSEYNECFEPKSRKKKKRDAPSIEGVIGDAVYSNIFFYCGVSNFIDYRKLSPYLVTNVNRSDIVCIDPIYHVGKHRDDVSTRDAIDSVYGMSDSVCYASYGTYDNSKRKYIFPVAREKRCVTMNTHKPYMYVLDKSIGLNFANRWFLDSEGCLSYDKGGINTSVLCSVLGSRPDSEDLIKSFSAEGIDFPSIMFVSNLVRNSIVLGMGVDCMYKDISTIIDVNVGFFFSRRSKESERTPMYRWYTIIIKSMILYKYYYCMDVFDSNFFDGIGYRGNELNNFKVLSKNSSWPLCCNIYRNSKINPRNKIVQDKIHYVSNDIEKVKEGDELMLNDRDDNVKNYSFVRTSIIQRNTEEYPSAIISSLPVKYDGRMKYKKDMGEQLDIRNINKKYSISQDFSFGYDKDNQTHDMDPKFHSSHNAYLVTSINRMSHNFGGHDKIDKRKGLVLF
jgi:hypothetical protein